MHDGVASTNCEVEANQVGCFPDSESQHHITDLAKTNGATSMRESLGTSTLDFNDELLNFVKAVDQV